MAKHLPDAGMDAALTYYTDADKMTLCSAQPTTYTEGNTTYALADVAPTFDAIANGDTSGRKRRMQAKTAVDVDANGTGNHVALLKTGDTTLRAVTTCTGVAVDAAGTVDIGAWDIEVADVTP
jgi:hypothetical protein